MEAKDRFEVILNEQTPEVPAMKPGDCVEWIKNNKDLISDFKEFSQASELIARGYAANQLWDNETDERCMARMFSKKNEKGIFEVFINPRITGIEGEYFAEELCLSWPGKVIVVEERYKKIKVKYWNERGHEEITELEGDQAQIWQHEQDHLDGVEEDVRDKDWKTIRGVTKIGRNEKCPCGSGKKYKKCCLK